MDAMAKVTICANPQTITVDNESYELWSIIEVEDSRFLLLHPVGGPEMEATFLVTMSSVEAAMWVTDQNVVDRLLELLEMSNEAMAEAEKVPEQSMMN